MFSKEFFNESIPENRMPLQTKQTKRAALCAASLSFSLVFFDISAFICGPSMNWVNPPKYPPLTQLRLSLSPVTGRFDSLRSKRYTDERTQPPSTGADLRCPPQTEYVRTALRARSDGLIREAPDPAA